MAMVLTSGRLDEPLADEAAEVLGSNRELRRYTRRCAKLLP